MVLGSERLMMSISREKLIPGKNNLCTTHPELLKEWNTKKNKDLLPTNFTAGSSKKVWWKCKVHSNHEWESRISHRASGSGCPFCSGNKVLEGFNDLQSKHPSIAKEWHSEKNEGLSPSQVNHQSNKKFWWKCSQDGTHEWKASIYKRTESGNGCPICSGKQVLIGFNDLVTTHPEIAKEWNTKKNKDLLPTNFSAGSSKKIWWQCSLDHTHEWTAVIHARTGTHKTGCPICKNKKILVGKNDLASTHPEIALSWHPTKNKSLKIENFSAGSSRQKIWWQCQKYVDHEWELTVKDRVNSGGCPICSGHTILSGFNDLQTLEPELARYWHKTKNKMLMPSQVSRYSGQKVWWQCPQYPDHEWQTTISNRTVRGDSCPICSGKKVLKGFNDLETLREDLSKEWHPVKNGDLKPSEVPANSNKKVWWLCANNPKHEWKTSVNNRSHGTNCPICANLVVLEGFNDLATTHPDLAKQWHPTKNLALEPTCIVAGSTQKVWWQCPQYPDHEWQATLESRSMQGVGCPICSGHQLLQGFNDLETTHPDIANEWHSSRNHNLSPKQVSAGSGKKVWWQCSVNSKHEWETTISNRLSTGCPSCAEHGFNPSKESWFYLMERPGEQQIGITNDIITRLRTHERNGWHLLEKVGPLPGEEVLKTETQLKRWIKSSVGLVGNTRENWSSSKLEVSNLKELKEKSGIQTDIF